jgi:tetratricopeptide (TPR) repeat protein
MEQAGRPADAADAWQAALHRWPDNTTALFGLGNSQLALGDTESAERSYEKLIAASPGLVVARNNLAMALAQEHRFDAALEEIDRALRLNDDESIQPILEGTRTEILSMAK